MPVQLQFFNTRKLTYKICLDLSVLHLFLSGAFWEAVQCTARVDNGYSAITGAHRHEAASSSWLTSLFLMLWSCSSWLISLFPMWWWSCCFCGLEKSCILHMAIELAVLMMKTFLCKNLGNCSCSTQSSA